MKICFWHFYTFRMRRGIEILVVSLANALARKGVEVSIVTASPQVELFVKPDPAVKVFYYPTFRYFEHATIVPFYLNHFRRHKYDHVFAFFADFGEGWTVRLLKFFCRLPLVLYLCYAPSSVKHRYDSFLKFGWDKEAAKVLTVADWIAKEVEFIFKRPVSVLPVGTDPVIMRRNDEFREKLRKKNEYQAKDIVLLSVSALEKSKGVSKTIQAMGRLKEKFPDLKFYILGKGSYEPSLRAMVKNLNLEDRVIFGGESAKHPQFYNMADIFVMLPDAEANSLAFHEAMSAELPVLASDTPGFFENSTPESVLCVDADDAGLLDEAIIRLAKDAALRHSMGKAGRQYVLDHCSWEKNAERLLEILR